MGGADAHEVRQLAVDLIASSQLSKRRMRTIVRKTARDIERDAKIYAPVDTGFLQNSITSEVSETEDGVRGEVGPTAYYGIHQELGTATHGAQPFLFPALDRHEGAFYAAMNQAADPEL